MAKTIYSLALVLVLCIFLSTWTGAEEKEKPADSAETSSPAPIPDVIRLDSLEKIYGPVDFSHGMHVGVAENCAACHHHTEAGETPPCKACHEKPFDPKNLNIPGLKGAYHLQCMNCHKEMGSGPVGCTDCHAKKEKGSSK